MRQRWLSRLAVVSAAVGIAALATAAPAWANITININPGNVPTTAAGADNNNTCDPDLGGGPFPDKDVWVFNLPDQTRDFVSVTAEFSTDGDDTTVEQTLMIPTDGGAIVRQGTSKAWIATPAGWTLVDATAEVTGDAPTGNTKVFFVLTHTCAATSTPSGSPTPSESPSESPSGTPSETPSESGSSTPGATSSAPGGGGGGLPVTGTAIGGIVVVGVGLVAAGVALLAVRRRREIDLTDL
jgi:LPXTG-motif cell wall-anchored protein